MTITEPIFTMILAFLVALFLGFVIAWFFLKVVYKRKDRQQADEHAAYILERNNLIEKLQKSLDKKKSAYEALFQELDQTEATLAVQTTEVTKLQKMLTSLNSNKGESESIRRQNTLLNLELEKVKGLYEKASRELTEFETVLVHAEDKLEENERNAQQIIKSLDKEFETLSLINKQQQQQLKENHQEILSLKEDLKLYHANNRDPEFIITKDQFIKIEEQLKEYQEEIVHLKQENSELASKIAKVQKLPSNALVPIDELRSQDKQQDDSSMVRVFRDTYKKITKS